MRNALPTSRLTLVGLAAAAVLCTLGGCAGPRPAYRVADARGVHADELRAIEGSRSPVAAREAAGAWVAAGPAGAPNRMLAGRRDPALLTAPPVSMISASVWPGGSIPAERRRLPVIYSHWGRSH